MSKIVVEVTEGSEVLAISSDVEVETAYVVTSGTEQIATMNVGCNPEIISEVEARMSVTSEDID